jgi:hypothetical protein
MEKIDTKFAIITATIQSLIDAVSKIGRSDEEDQATSLTILQLVDLFVDNVQQNSVILLDYSVELVGKVQPLINHISELAGGRAPRVIYDLFLAIKDIQGILIYQLMMKIANLSIPI